MSSNPTTPTIFLRALRLLRHALVGLALLLGLGVLLVTLVAPALPTPESPFRAPASLTELEPALAAAESQVPGLRPGAERRVVWAHPHAVERTPLVLVYLHGFSASPQELDPVPQRVAAALGANLYYARVPGHGRTAEAMAESSRDSWTGEGESALAVARLLGERVVLMGCSTGGTLATWLAERHPELAAVVLVSPNYAVQAPGASLAAGPGGQGIVRLVQGEFRSFHPHTPLHAARWTWRYSTAAIPPMLKLVRTVAAEDPAQLRVPVLAFYSPRDTVVKPQETVRRIVGWGSAIKRLEAVDTQDPDHHVLAGDALSPATTDRVVEVAVAFVRSLPARAPGAVSSPHSHR